MKVKQWIVFIALITALQICNSAQNYVIGRPLAFTVIFLTIFFVTPVVIKKRLEDENMPALTGALILTTIAIYIASSVIINIYDVPTLGINGSEKYGARFWTSTYLVLTAGAFSGLRKIMNN